MKAVVTGGSGYFGTALCRKLLEAGHDVAVFDLHPPVAGRFIEGDVRDAGAVAGALEGADVVFHAVAQVPLARKGFMAVNVDGTRHVLAAAGDRRVVVVSSSAVFGVPDRVPVTEDMVPRPREAYGRAKYAAELLCEGRNVAIVRPRTILGPGRLGIFSVLFDWIARGAAVPVLGKGDNLYQFVHADDLAGLCILAAGRDGYGVYHGGAATYGTMREALENLGARVRGVPRRLAEWGMRTAGALRLAPLAPYHALMYGRSMAFSIEKARAELGWEPMYSNDAMFTESYEWFLRHRDEARRTSPHLAPAKEGLLRIWRWLS